MFACGSYEKFLSISADKNVCREQSLVFCSKLYGGKSQAMTLYKLFSVCFKFVISYKHIHLHRRVCVYMRDLLYTARWSSNKSIPIHGLASIVYKLLRAEMFLPISQSPQTK